VDTVTLLKLIHDSFALSKETGNETLFNAAQSLLSVLVYNLRHPLAHIDDSHGDTIRQLETALAAHRSRKTRRRRTGTAG
jgi:hypothetical protein